MITTSFNVPSHLYINTAMSDVLLFDQAVRFAECGLDASFYTCYVDLKNHHLSFILLFLIASLHVICKDWQLSSSVAAQSDTCD